MIAATIESSCRGRGGGPYGPKFFGRAHARIAVSGNIDFSAVSWGTDEVTLGHRQTVICLRDHDTSTVIRPVGVLLIFLGLRLSFRLTVERRYRSLVKEERPLSVRATEVTLLQESVFDIRLAVPHPLGGTNTPSLHLHAVFWSGHRSSN